MSFIHLKKGNRLSTYMKFEGESKFSKDYMSITVPLDAVLVDGAEIKERTLEAGTFAVLLPKCSIDPRMGRVMVCPNAALSAHGAVSYQPVIEQGEGDMLGITIDVKSSINLADLPWLVRLYFAE